MRATSRLQTSFIVTASGRCSRRTVITSRITSGYSRQGAAPDRHRFICSSENGVPPTVRWTVRSCRRSWGSIPPVRRPGKRRAVEAAPSGTSGPRARGIAPWVRYSTEEGSRQPLRAPGSSCPCGPAERHLSSGCSAWGRPRGPRSRHRHGRAGEPTVELCGPVRIDGWLGPRLRRTPTNGSRACATSPTHDWPSCVSSTCCRPRSIAATCRIGARPRPSCGGSCGAGC